MQQTSRTNLVATREAEQSDLKSTRTRRLGKFVNEHLCGRVFNHELI